MKQKARRWGWAVAVIMAALIPSAAFASGFGEGVFGAHVPFGAATSISIALGGDVSIPLSSNGSAFTGTASNTVTVTSTDVVGYMLYAHPTSGTSMTSGTASIAASSNGTETGLATGTWGYNTSGSTTTFLGMGSSVLLKDATGPFETGDTTTVTYGALTSLSQDAGTYTIPITYTVVAKSP